MKHGTALVAGLAALLAGATGASAGEGVDITYAGGLLTIRCSRIKLGEVLEQVGTATGMTLLLDDAVKGTVLTADIEAQPVQIALERLLEGRGVSYAMSLSPDGQGVAQMLVGNDAEKSVASTGAGRPHPAASARANRRASELAVPARRAPVVEPVADDEDEVDAEPDDPSPFAGLAEESIPGLPVSAPSAVAAAKAGPPAVEGTPPVPVTFPGSPQPYYPVLDPFGRPIPMPQATPAPPAEQKPGAPLNQ